MKSNDPARTIASFDVPLTDQAVIRLERKVWDGDEYLNVHLWGRDKKGNLFPRKGRGLCFQHEAWEKILKAFTVNGLPIPRTRTEDLNAPINDTKTNG